MSRLRVAIVGCGKIADQHVQAIQRISDSVVIAVCDHEPLMAQQLAERFRINACHSDLEELLRLEKPDVVHITSPPQSHCALALQCLDAGCHVYLEKPFTVTAQEAEVVLAEAQRVKRLVTAGHNYQFSFEMLRMREMLADGFLGATPVHLESYWSYDLGDINYVGPLLGNADHWVRRLPGGLLHNIISHGIARLAEFLDDDISDLVARAHQSEQLRELGGQEVLDELRVLIRDGKGTTATFCFSTQLRPGLNLLRLHGPKNSISVDLVGGSVIAHRGSAFKSYLTYFVPPLLSAREHLRNAWQNTTGILRRRIYQDAGMKELIERFHVAVAGGGAAPIPYREILLTARLMDSIFERMRGSATSVVASPARVTRPPNQA